MLVPVEVERSMLSPTSKGNASLEDVVYSVISSYLTGAHDGDPPIKDGSELATTDGIVTVV